VQSVTIAAVAPSIFKPDTWRVRNLLVNGGFEQGAFPPPHHVDFTGYVQLVNGDYDAIPGWAVTITKLPNPPVVWLQNGNPYQLVAAEGARCLDLTGENNVPVGVMFGAVDTRDPVMTEKGRRYTLSLQLGSKQGDPYFSSPVGVYVTTHGVGATPADPLYDEPLYPIVRDPAPGDPASGMQWSTHTVTFTADADRTWISIIGMDREGARSVLDLPQSQFIGLDDVSLRETPWFYVLATGVLWWMVAVLGPIPVIGNMLDPLRRWLDVGLMPQRASRSA
jgi:hypothetical protein